MVRHGLIGKRGLGLHPFALRIGKRRAIREICRRQRIRPCRIGVPLQVVRIATAGKTGLSERLRSLTIRDTVTQHILVCLPAFSIKLGFGKLHAVAVNLFDFILFLLLPFCVSHT